MTREEWLRSWRPSAERDQRLKQQERDRRAARRLPKVTPRSYTLADLASAQDALEAALSRTENTRHNNPNRGRAALSHARLVLSDITADLQQRGVIPKPEPSAKQLRDQALDQAFPNGNSREEVEHDGKRYRRRFAKAQYGWDRWWEEVE